MAELNYTSSESNNHVVKEDENLNVNDEHSLFMKYHKSEIDQNDMIIKNAIYLIWAGFALVVLGLFFAVFLEKNYLAVLPGAFIDIFSATIIFMVNKSSETKQKYFESLSNRQHENKIIDLIHISKNDDFREQMISKIVDSQFKS